MVHGLQDGNERTQMAIIACKLIVEHNLLDGEPSRPRVTVNIDPLSDLASFFREAERHATARRQTGVPKAAQPEPPRPSVEEPRRVLLSSSLRCHRCTSDIKAGTYSCWSSIGAVYHPQCWDMFQAEKTRKSWNP
jgi:hypothetical protein